MRTSFGLLADSDRWYAHLLAQMKSASSDPPEAQQIGVMAELAVASAVGGSVTVPPLPAVTDRGIDVLAPRGWLFQVKGTKWPNGSLRLEHLRYLNASHFLVFAYVDLEAWAVDLLGWMPTVRFLLHSRGVDRQNRAGEGFRVYELEEPGALSRDFDRLERVICTRDAPPLPWSSYDSRSVLP